MNDDNDPRGPSRMLGLVLVLFPAALVLDALIVWALVAAWQWVTR